MEGSFLDDKGSNVFESSIALNARLQENRFGNNATDTSILKSQV